MIEVKKAIMSEEECKCLKLSKPRVYQMYPQQSAPGFCEHRFYCPHCRKEFIYDTSEKTFYQIPEDWPHVYNPKLKLLVSNPKVKAETHNK